MHRKAARLFFFTAIALAIATSRPSSAQQPATAKQMQAPGPAYQDARWSSEDDIQLLKRDLRSQPDETALASARFQDKRVTELAAQFIAGR